MVFSNTAAPVIPVLSYLNLSFFRSTDTQARGYRVDTWRGGSWTAAMSRVFVVACPLPRRAAAELYTIISSLNARHPPDQQHGRTLTTAKQATRTQSLSGQLSCHQRPGPGWPALRDTGLRWLLTHPAHRPTTAAAAAEPQCRTFALRTPAPLSRQSKS